MQENKNLVNTAEEGVEIRQHECQPDQTALWQEARLACEPMIDAIIQHVQYTIVQLEHQVKLDLGGEDEARIVRNQLKRHHRLTYASYNAFTQQQEVQTSVFFLGLLHIPSAMFNLSEGCQGSNEWSHQGGVSKFT